MNKNISNNTKLMKEKENYKNENNKIINKMKEEKEKVKNKLIKMKEVNKIIKSVNNKDFDNINEISQVNKMSDSEIE